MSPDPGLESILIHCATMDLRSEDTAKIWRIAHSFIVCDFFQPHGAHFGLKMAKKVLIEKEHI